MRDRLVSPTTKNIDLQLTTDTLIYASGDVLVATVALPLIGATPMGPIRAFIDKITLVDQSSQSGLLDFVFLDSNVSFGVANAVAALSAANALKICGAVSITSAGQYINVGSATVATVQPTRPIFIQTVPGDNNIYLALLSRDAKTYAATALTVRVSLTLVSEEI